jgi:Ca-activated chloride channel family protein
MGRRRASLGHASLAALVCALGSAAADGQDRIRSGARTVAIYATVTDAAGRLVPDLTRDDFEVYDNGRLQPLTIFSAEVQPITVVMLLDRSASMQTNFRLVEVAAGEFVKRLGPADKARIGSFAARVQVDPRDFTSDHGEMQNILRSELQPAGPTPLWNAVAVGVTALLRQDGRRVVLVFTDGADAPLNGSSNNVSQKEATRRAQAENVMVYAIGLTSEMRFSRRGGPGRIGGMRGGVPGRRSVTVRQRPDEGLSKIANETGGGYFELTRAADLGATFARVADELHRQYALGFEPARLDGKSHRLEVRVKRPGLVARARRSYLANP